MKKVARRVIDARELWQKIISSISMYGCPKIMFKEAMCSKSNHMIGQNGIKCGGLEGDCPMIVS